MTKQLIVFMGLSLATVSVVPALQPVRFSEKKKNSIVGLAKIFSLLKNQKGSKRKSDSYKQDFSNGEGAQKSASKKKYRGPKKIEPMASSVSDDILEFAYKRNGKNLGLLTSSEKDQLKASLENNIKMLEGGKVACILCEETRGTYERVASHIACDHHGVKEWRKSSEDPSYSNYSGFAASQEIT